MEEFKKIEDYPIVGKISQEELSKYDDYIEKDKLMKEKISVLDISDKDENIKCLCDDCECNECYDCGECTGYSTNKDE